MYCVKGTCVYSQRVRRSFFDKLTGVTVKYRCGHCGGILKVRKARIMQ